MRRIRVHESSRSSLDRGGLSFPFLPASSRVHVHVHMCCSAVEKVLPRLARTGFDQNKSAARTV
eukprot:scaffold4212_cov122-Isochrysis_galbana.AAC.13